MCEIGGDRVSVFPMRAGFISRSVISCTDRPKSVQAVSPQCRAVMMSGHSMMPAPPPLTTSERGRA